MSRAILALFAALLAGSIASQSAVAKPLDFKRYAQEPRALMAIAIAVQELADCDGDLAFTEEELTEDGTTIAVVKVVCQNYPTVDDKTAAATVTIEMGIDDERIPTGPISFDYQLP